jgi:hypothetical protein
LKVKDSSGKLRVIRCRKRNGDYDKPVLSIGWLQFVADYGRELVTGLFFFVRMTIASGHSSGLKQREKSSCLARRFGVMSLELTSYYLHVRAGMHNREIQAWCASLNSCYVCASA